MSVERVTDPGDPRLRDFTELRDVELRTAREADEGLFIAEGEKTIRRALAAGYEPRAFLLTEAWLASVEPLAGDAPIYVVPDDVLDATTGYPVHRGALASFNRRPLPSLDEVLADARRIAVLEDVQDHTNLGAIFRSAAALGVDAVVLTPRGADPLVPSRDPDLDGHGVLGTVDAHPVVRGTGPAPRGGVHAPRAHAGDRRASTCVTSTPPPSTAPRSRSGTRATGSASAGSAPPTCACGSRCARGSTR